MTLIEFKKKLDEIVDETIGEYGDISISKIVEILSKEGSDLFSGLNGMIVVNGAEKAMKYMKDKEEYHKIYK